MLSHFLRNGLTSSGSPSNFLGAPVCPRFGTNLTTPSCWFVCPCLLVGVGADGPCVNVACDITESCDSIDSNVGAPVNNRLSLLMFLLIGGSVSVNSPSTLIVCNSGGNACVVIGVDGDLNLLPVDDVRSVSVSDSLLPITLAAVLSLYAKLSSCSDSVMFFCYYCLATVCCYICCCIIGYGS